jgi:hypothetical protein
MVTTPALYSGAPGFQGMAWGPVNLIFSWSSSVPSGKLRDHMR